MDKITRKNPADDAAESDAIASSAGERSSTASISKTTRNIGFAVILLGTMLGGFTQTATNTSMTHIMTDLGISVGLSQWLTTVYPLVMGIVIPCFAFLSRKHSFRSLFLVAIGTYMAGTFIIVIAHSFAPVLIGRILEAATSGILFPLITLIALLRFDPAHRGTVMGIVGLTMGFAPNFGPTLAGFFTTAYGWRSAFVFLLIFASVVFVAGIFLVKDTGRDEREGHALDFASVVLSTLGFGGLLMGFSCASNYGIVSVACLVPLAIGTLALVAFIRRQSAIENPLLDLRVFHYRDFAVGTVIICFLFAAFIGITLVIPLDLQGLHGQTALVSGLVLLPGTFAAAIASPGAGALMDKIGARPVILGGAAIICLGTVMLLRLGDTSDVVYVSIWQTVRTFGISSIIMPTTTWSLNCLPRELAADGTATTNAFRQLAAALSTSLMVLIMTFGDVNAEISAGGVDATMAVSLGLAAAILVLGAVFVKGTGHAAAKS